jgi:hypothetical protein
LAEYSVHTVRVARKFEWFGLTILKRYLARPLAGSKVEDVHDDPHYFSKGIDLILHEPPIGTRTIDVKVDSYYGSDPTRKIRGLCNPDSGFILLETISQLQYDRKTDPDSGGTIPVRGRGDVPGWFFTEKADEVFYYYLALLNAESELNPIYGEYVNLVKLGSSTSEIENKLLRSLRVDRDLLVTFKLEEARKWYEAAPASAFLGFAAAPNPTYLTLSRRAYRDNFISNGPGKSHGPIFPTVVNGLDH